MLIERGKEGQIVSREVRKQWREGKGLTLRWREMGIEELGSERKQRREEKAKWRGER